MKRSPAQTARSAVPRAIRTAQARRPAICSTVLLQRQSPDLMVSIISQSSFVQTYKRNVAGSNSQFTPSWTRSVTSMGLLPNQSTAVRTWPLSRAPQVPSTSPTSRRTRTAELFPLVSETVVSYVPMPLALIRPVMLGQATRSVRAIGSRFSLTVLGESSPVSLT